MAVPQELTGFFTKLVEKSKKLEVNWQATGQADTYAVRFSDIAIRIAQVSGTRAVRIELLNDEGRAVADMTVDDNDNEWIAATSLINSANRKVSKIDQTIRRALEELGREGPVGEEPATLLG